MAPSTLKSQWWNWVARQKIDPHLPIHGLRDSFGTWVYETYGVKQAQEWLGHSDPATTLRHYVRLTTAARAKAVAGLDEVTRAALERAEEKVRRGRAAARATTSSARQPASLTLPTSGLSSLRGARGRGGGFAGRSKRTVPAPTVRVSFRLDSGRGTPWCAADLRAQGSRRAASLTHRRS